MDSVNETYNDLMLDMTEMLSPETPFYAYALIGSLAAVAGVIFLLVIVWLISMYYEPLGAWCETTTGCCIPGREKPQVPKDEMQLPKLEPDYGPDANGEIHIPRAHLVDKNRKPIVSQQPINKGQKDKSEMNKAHHETEDNRKNESKNEAKHQKNDAKQQKEVKQKCEEKRKNDAGPKNDANQKNESKPKNGATPKSKGKQ